ncbi:WAT1-related protein At5g64700-like [Carya illinoinensis]|uniref:WAT1-related protein At5g64700-like n=1 Tax=Carya illinoinensis TaxID=32201 RepID=UPI001C728727|nr:WAT1-related protein At5g64700-like [Carya illinoinensis]
MERVKKWFAGSKVGAAMIMVQLFVTGMQLLMRAMLGEGTFVFKYIAYRSAVAAICVAPLAFYFERGSPKKFKWSVWFWLFLNALVGITMCMGLYAYGLRDTTATYGTTFFNLVPISAFLFSILAGIEKLGLNTRPGRLKAMGAIFCVAGVLIASLCDGKAFHIRYLSPHSRWAHHAKSSKDHWVRGNLLLTGFCLSMGAWFVVQVKLLKVFPFKYCAIMLTCVIATIQATVIGVCADRRKDAWKLRWKLELLTIVYSGALNTAASFCLVAWASTIRGPTYPPIFNPLSQILVTMLESVIFGEEITLGIIVGMIVIIIGLYSFLWGKNMEMERDSLDQNNIASGSMRSEGSITII